MSRILAIAATLAIAACTSPEANRMRGGGPGADRGNRVEIVRMHEGSRPFFGTPQLAPGKSAPVESADHARESSG